MFERWGDVGRDGVEEFGCLAEDGLVRSDDVGNWFVVAGRETDGAVERWDEGAAAREGE